MYWSILINMFLPVRPVACKKFSVLDTTTRNRLYLLGNNRYLAFFQWLNPYMYVWVLRSHYLGASTVWKCTAWISTQVFHWSQCWLILPKEWKKYSKGLRMQPSHVNISMMESEPRLGIILFIYCCCVYCVTIVKVWRCLSRVTCWMIKQFPDKGSYSEENPSFAHSPWLPAVT